MLKRFLAYYKPHMRIFLLDMGVRGAALATILTVTTIISLLIVFRATKGKVKIV